MNKNKFYYEVNETAKVAKREVILLCIVAVLVLLTAFIDSL